MAHFQVSGDPTAQQNGDIAIRTSNGRLVALVYASGDKTANYATAIAAALNAAFSPGMTDMMLTPEQMDAWLEQNPPSDA